MKFKTILSYVFHPFLSLLCLSILFMAVALMLDRSANSVLALSPEDSRFVFIFGTIFVLYPVLVVAFALPSLIMGFFQFHYGVRTAVFLILGVMCMFPNTILSEYSFLYIAIAITFAMIDFFYIKYRTIKQLQR